MENINLKKLQELRHENNYTIQDMADKLNISISYYCQIEHGNRNLYYKMAVKIAKVFKMKPDEIFYVD